MRYPGQGVASFPQGRMSGPFQQGARMSTTTVRLFRGVRKDAFADGVVVDDKPATGILYPSFESRVFERARADGGVDRRIRPADTRPFAVDDVMMVAAFKGTSLLDRQRAFGSAHWRYFTIPAGTEVPGSILVRHTGRLEAYAAEHYQIEPAMGRMRLDAYRGALDNLARSAVVRFIAESGGTK